MDTSLWVATTPTGCTQQQQCHAYSNAPAPPGFCGSKWAARRPEAVVQRASLPWPLPRTLADQYPGLWAKQKPRCLTFESLCLVGRPGACGECKCSTQRPGWSGEEGSRQQRDPALRLLFSLFRCTQRQACCVRRTAHLTHRDNVNCSCGRELQQMHLTGHPRASI